MSHIENVRDMVKKLEEELSLTLEPEEEYEEETTKNEVTKSIYLLVVLIACVL